MAKNTPTVDSTTLHNRIVRELKKLLDDETEGLKPRNPTLRDAVYAVIRTQRDEGQ